MSQTKIPQRFSAVDLTDANIAAGAAIASTKLADGANFIKKDGTVAMTGALNMGSQLVTNVQTPSAGTDAANRSYVDTQISNLNSLFTSKGAAVAASTANVLISNPGTAVFDGVTVLTTQRILLKNQSAPAENGLWIFNGSGVALTRDTEMDTWAEVPGALIVVENGGTANGNTIWLSTSVQSGTIGSTAISFTQLPSTAGLLNSNFVTEEVPSGTVNGSNVTFTLANTPVAGSQKLFCQGVRLHVGAGNDYTISGATITMLVAPLTGEILLCDYRK